MHNLILNKIIVLLSLEWVTLETSKEHIFFLKNIKKTFNFNEIDE
jgi:hypothetical protein